VSTALQILTANAIVKDAYSYAGVSTAEQDQLKSLGPTGQAIMYAQTRKYQPKELSWADKGKEWWHDAKNWGENDLGGTVKGDVVRRYGSMDPEQRKAALGTAKKWGETLAFLDPAVSGAQKLWRGKSNLIDTWGKLSSGEKWGVGLGAAGLGLALGGGALLLKKLFSGGGRRRPQYVSAAPQMMVARRYSPQ